MRSWYYNTDLETADLKILLLTLSPPLSPLIMDNVINPNELEFRSNQIKKQAKTKLMEVTLFSYLVRTLLKKNSNIVLLLLEKLQFSGRLENIKFSPFLLSFFAWRPFYYHENL